MKELREARSILAELETKLEKIASDSGRSLEDVVDEFDGIVGEFTSAYHDPYRLRVVVVE